MTKPNKSYIRVSYGEDGNPQIETNCVRLETSKPYLRVQYGDDGNPEVETTCIGIDATNLCIALVAALAANSADPETWLIRVMTNAADLLDRVETEEDKDNETVF